VRLTSPQAAIVSSMHLLISCMAGLRLALTMPWNWNVWRVVSLNVLLPRSSAMASMARHWSGVQTPAGRRRRTMNE